MHASEEGGAHTSPRERLELEAIVHVRKLDVDRAEAALCVRVEGG